MCFATLFPSVHEHEHRRQQEPRLAMGCNKMLRSDEEQGPHEDGGDGDKGIGNACPVFDVTELLEQILLHLPFKTVFVCQSVCRRFRTVIAESSLLRQEMFLAPGPPTHDTPEVCPVLNPQPYRRTNGPHRHKPPRQQPDEVVCCIPASDVSDGVISATSRTELYLTSPPTTRLRRIVLRWEVRGADGSVGCCEYDHQEALHDPRGFTIGRLLHAALHETEDVVPVETRWRSKTLEDEIYYPHKTCMEVIADLEAEKGGKARFLGGVVVIPIQ